MGIARKNPPASIELVDINGSPGVILRHKSGRVDTVMLLEVAEGQVTRLYSMRNPDKLVRAS
jgi:RNA polymerase sigma-70 factor (ECF subfamily)